jgi:hypothetical protein
VEIVGYIFYNIIALFILELNRISIISLDLIEDFSLNNRDEYKGQNDLIDQIVLFKLKGVL